MKAIALLLLALLLGGCTGCSSLPTHDQLRATTLTLRFTQGLCSGTAIGRDLVLSAQHCFANGPLVSINGQPVKVLGYGKDKHDLATIRVSGIVFEKWAKLGKRLHQGDRVRWWGNPQGVADVYREGYVSLAHTDQVIIDAPICQGDSGAGIFNARGQVVGVVTSMNDLNGCTFMFSYPMQSA